MTIYVIWTEPYGFEPCVFTELAAAVAEAEKLKGWVAYRNVRIEVMSHNVLGSQCSVEETL